VTNARSIDDTEIAQPPGAPALALPEMRDYRATYDGFRWEIPESFNFGGDVVDAWATDPERPALIWCDAAGAEQRYSFADIARLSARFANLLADNGIGRGDRVVIMLPRIPEWQIATVGCLKLGAVAVPCIDMLSARDLAYRVEHSGARAIVTTAANAAKAPETEALVLRVAIGGAPGWLDYEAAISAADEAFAPVAVTPGEPAMIYYTSGTTGPPKGVTLGAGALFTWRVQARYWLDLGPGDLMWCTADTGWSKAGTGIIFGPWSLGAPVLFYDGPFEPARRLELLARYRVTVFCAAATELRHLVYEDVAEHDLSALRRTVSAGETLNPEVAKRWSELTGAPTHEGYGQTETLMTVHTYPATPAKPGSMGLPLPGYRMAVVREDGSTTEPGEPGVLAVAVPNPALLLGYWREPQRLAKVMVENEAGEWYLTGDSAYLDEDGYIFFVGRADDIISSAGYRIGPSEVENVLLEHPAVREGAAVASPDKARGEIVKAFVVLADGVDPTPELAAELQDHVKALTAPYKYPRAVEFVDELPKNASGKLLRKVLRDQEYAAKDES
jgi:acyl-coenzyme A synthetase/AMP-(fatty) acid ligase